jgi:quinol monooxygenase YgiN
MVIAKLSVPDFDRWFAEYEGMHPVRASFGERSHRLYRDVDDPTTITVVFEWESVDAARRYFGSAELAASVNRAEAHAGPQVCYLEPVADCPTSTD